MSERVANPRFVRNVRQLILDDLPPECCAEGIHHHPTQPRARFFARIFTLSVFFCQTEALPVKTDRSEHHLSIDLSIYVYIYPSIYLYLYLYLYIHTYINAHMYMYTHMYIYIHTYIHIYFPPECRAKRIHHHPTQPCTGLLARIFAFSVLFSQTEVRLG